ncbi:hypothetical protein [Desertimonas flava]|uniref:hypothetical protein n=1 Tax=Desertimonas flava TaxID=2064846 RepID=UPI000E353A83|nr:hypothetical protein [Desertimonas flava]
MRVPRTDGLRPDRYVEIDLDWFEPHGSAQQATVAEFVERTAPLWRGRRGECGVILNPAFLVDVVTEFGGELDQRLPMRTARYVRWRDATYADLGRLAADLRAEATRAGVPGLRVGLFVAGVGRVITGSDIYDLESDWCDRHPELYPFDLSPLPGPDLDPRVPLRADGHRYAAFPEGIDEGTRFADVLAAQWAAVAEACGLDVIHLRDGFWGPMLYTRRGPYGVTPSTDPAENESWTIAVRDLFAAVKRARPTAMVMAYTSGIGATAEWRSGCIDTAEVLRGGGVDVLIDQTWGGAWQDWWDDWWKGWTNQHTNLLSHGVAVRRSGRPVRHYKLIETWDGWEPFDTVHDVPGKLRWAMWAWSHAAVVTPEGLEVPDGTYVSWMNDRQHHLLDADAVSFVSRELDAAEDDAAGMHAVGGPLLVFDHDAVAAVHAWTPRRNSGEHIEDAVALAMKWGLPVLAATAGEWLDRVRTDGGAVVQLGTTVTGRPAAPLVVVGRADAVSPELLAAAGATCSGETRRSGYHRERIAFDGEASNGWIHLAGDACVEISGDDVEVLAEADEWPTLVASDRDGEGSTPSATAWWQPPELADPSNPLLPRSQYGSVAAARAVARWWSRQPAPVAVEDRAIHEPLTVQWWESAGGRTLLLGNLETGWLGDSRTPRSAAVRIDEITLRFDVPAERCVVASVSEAGGTVEVVAS